jgi:hypothetical protein
MSLRRMMMFTLGGVSYSPEYQTYLNRLTTLGIPQPNDFTKQRHNDAVVAMVNSGIWNKTRSMKFLWNSTLDAARIDIRNPTLFQGTVFGGLSFVTNSGIVGNGVDAYFNTGFAPDQGGGIYQDNNAGCVLRVVNGGTLGLTAVMSQVLAASQVRMQLVNSTAGLRINSGQNMTAAFNYTAAAEVKAGYRDSSTALRLFRNTTRADRTQTSRALTSQDISLLRIDTVYSNATLGGIFWAGASLTDAEHTTLVGIINNLIA